MRLASDKIRFIAAVIAPAAAIALVLPFAMKSPPPAPAPAPAQIDSQNAGLNIPTIDQMCALRGTVGGALAQCREDERAAQEYVGAWMGFNGFVNEGGLDVEQIQLQASLGDSDPFAANPLADADPSTAVAGLDVTPDQFQSPAQLAMYCLTGADDWLKLHDCLAENDRGAVTGNADLDNPPPDFDPAQGAP